MSRHQIIQEMLDDIEEARLCEHSTAIEHALEEGVAAFEASRDYVHLGDAEIQILNGRPV